MRIFPLALICTVTAGGILYAIASRRASLHADVEVTPLSSATKYIVKEPQTSAGLCPWRSPDEDRKRYFPTAVSSRDETLILSRQRLELQRRMGRKPAADDNALIVHRILDATGSPGVVVTRRVRGECGLIELVLAADADGRLIGAKIQRNRELESTAAALKSPEWLGAFRGKDSRSAWRLGLDIPAVPSGAQPSAQAIVDEARTVLIMLDVALHSDSSLPRGVADSPRGQG